MAVPPKAITPPAFADDVVVSFTLKRSKDGDKQDAYIRLSFVDNLRREVIYEVVISPVTAEALVKVLSNTLAKMQEAMEGKTPVKQKEDATYIG